MNDLYLIGNGFDLAHGLKTSYNDFLLWYLENLIGRAELGKFSDELAEVDGSNSHFIFQPQESISKLLKYAEEKKIAIVYKNKFFQKIVENCCDYKWVDIEYEYYLALVEIYRDMERNNILRSDIHFTQVKELNYCFGEIKKKLVEYLSRIQITEKSQIFHIGKKLKEYTGIDATNSGKKLILNFNYTSTIDLYYNWDFNKNVQLVHIHGKLNDKSNPIIFGYGDEIDGYYNRMKQLNQNEFLKNMKSYEYLETSNNQKLNTFLEEEIYTVKIMGHSCGVSDRFLLNKIFEHPNCEKIKIFFHEKENSNDFSEKVKDISRHLEKRNVLDLVCERGISEPLIPYHE